MLPERMPPPFRSHKTDSSQWRYSLAFYFAPCFQAKKRLIAVLLTPPSPIDSVTLFASFPLRCAGEAEGGYLKRELVSGTTPGAAAAAASARPVGVALDGGAKGSEESKTGGRSAGGGSKLGGKTGGGSSGGKRTGKPSWLKIN